MQLPDRAKPPRRSETRDLVRPIIVALNRIPGVRVVRNANLGPVVPWTKRFDPGARPIIAGLGEGSADVVGVVTCQTLHCRIDHDDVVDGYPMYYASSRQLGRLFCLEVKLPDLRVNGKVSKRKGHLEADQERWLAAVRRFGGYAAVVHSIEEARACVEGCRRGGNGDLPF